MMMAEGKISKDGGLRKHASRKEGFPRQFFFFSFLSSLSLIGRKHMFGQVLHGQFTTLNSRFNDSGFM